MQVINNFVFYKDRTTASTAADMKPYINVRSGAMNLELSGTATTFSVTVQGRSNIANGDTWFNIAGIKVTDMTKSVAQTAMGIYQFDISGLQEVRVNIASISGGNITAFGRMVEEGA